MPEFTVTLDTTAAGFYRRIAGAAGLSIEQVLSDALFKLAGELALEAVAQKKQEN